MDKTIRFIPSDDEEEPGGNHPYNSRNRGPGSGSESYGANNRRYKSKLHGSHSQGHQITISR